MRRRNLLAYVRRWGVGPPSVQEFIPAAFKHPLIGRRRIKKTVSQDFSDAKLQVPLYQRSYAWESQQVEDLLNDIDYVNRRCYGSPKACSVTTAPSDADSNDTNGNSDVHHYFGTSGLNARGKQDIMGWE